MKPKTTDELFQVLPIQKVKGVLEEHKKKLEDNENSKKQIKKRQNVELFKSSRTAIVEFDNNAQDFKKLLGSLTNDIDFLSNSNKNQESQTSLLSEVEKMKDSSLFMPQSPFSLLFHPISEYFETFLMNNFVLGAAVAYNDLKNSILSSQNEEDPRLQFQTILDQEKLILCRKKLKKKTKELLLSQNLTDLDFCQCYFSRSLLLALDNQNTSKFDFLNYFLEKRKKNLISRLLHLEQTQFLPNNLKEDQNLSKNFQDLIVYFLITPVIADYCFLEQNEYILADILTSLQLETQKTLYLKRKFQFKIFELFFLKNLLDQQQKNVKKRTFSSSFDAMMQNLVSKITNYTKNNSFIFDFDSEHVFFAEFFKKFGSTQSIVINQNDEMKENENCQELITKIWFSEEINEKLCKFSTETIKSILFSSNSSSKSQKISGFLEIFTISCDIFQNFEKICQENRIFLTNPENLPPKILNFDNPATETLKNTIFNTLQQQKPILLSNLFNNLFKHVEFTMNSLFSSPDSNYSNFSPVISSDIAEKWKKFCCNYIKPDSSTAMKDFPDSLKNLSFLLKDQIKVKTGNFFTNFQNELQQKHELDLLPISQFLNFLNFEMQDFISRFSSKNLRKNSKIFNVDYFKLSVLPSICRKEAEEKKKTNLDTFLSAKFSISEVICIEFCCKFQEILENCFVLLQILSFEENLMLKEKILEFETKMVDSFVSKFSGNSLVFVIFLTIRASFQNILSQFWQNFESENLEIEEDSNKIWKNAIENFFSAKNSKENEKFVSLLTNFVNNKLKNLKNSKKTEKDLQIPKIPSLEIYQILFFESNSQKLLKSPQNLQKFSNVFVDFLITFEKEKQIQTKLEKESEILKIFNKIQQEISEIHSNSNEILQFYFDLKTILSKFCQNNSNSISNFVIKTLEQEISNSETLTEIEKNLKIFDFQTRNQFTSSSNSDSNFEIEPENFTNFFSKSKQSSFIPVKILKKSPNHGIPSYSAISISIPQKVSQPPKTSLTIPSTTTNAPVSLSPTSNPARNILAGTGKQPSAPEKEINKQHKRTESASRVLGSIWDNLKTGLLSPSVEGGGEFDQSQYIPFV